MAKTVADQMVDTLAAVGVECVYGIVGDDRRTRDRGGSLLCRK
jgi:hypothetical protein